MDDKEITGVMKPIDPEKAKAKDFISSSRKEPKTTMNVAFGFNIFTMCCYGLIGIIYLLIGIAIGTTIDSTIAMWAFIGLGFCLFLPLAWIIPMTVHLNHLRKMVVKPSVAFGVCTLLFVNIVSGILMLVTKDD